MLNNPIELELRGEINFDEIPTFETRLRRLGFRKQAITRRVSVMSFGYTSPNKTGQRTPPQTEIDLRCRVTNGKAEVVAKIGATHAANRLEITQPIRPRDLPNWARLFGSLGFFTKVGSKTTINYRRKDISIAIVQSPSRIVYIELEKMSNKQNEHKDLKELYALAKRLTLPLLKNRAAFLELCQRLTKQDDWEFHGTPKDLQRLKKEIKMAI